MRLPAELETRRSQPWQTNVSHKKRDGGSINTEGIIVFSVVIGLFLCGGLILVFVLRHLRKHHANPRYVPGSWLKAKWRAWLPSSEKKRYSSSLQDVRPGTRASSTVGFGALGPSSDNAAGSSGGQVDRNTSVRSTITLPEYSARARATEQILGREGERAGIDTVIEFPETVEEEEERRDEEMEGLYQIRRARREERDNREERRRLRREARTRQDFVTLEQLRQEALNETSRTSESLIASHQNRERGRRISSVNYLELGVARHDGSRVRANSTDSNHSLLGGAASMGGSDSASRLGAQLGNPSTASLRHLTADYSDDEGGSEADGLASPYRSRAGSVSTLQVLDSASSTGPKLPQYDEVVPPETASNLPRHPEPAVTAVPLDAPPDYTSPLRTGAPEFPPITTVPSIEVTPTPWSPVHT